TDWVGDARRRPGRVSEALDRVVRRIRRRARQVWYHRWPQARWWGRFLAGTALLERRRGSLAWGGAPAGPGGAGPAPGPPEAHVLAGAVHIHTTYSDGLGTVPEVAAAAREAGLDFVVITDHETLQPIADGWEGYHAGCLVLFGAEFRVHEGHILA